MMPGHQQLLEAVIFDLGGVVFDLDFPAVFHHWGEQAGVDAQLLAQRFEFDAQLSAFERGQLSTDRYCDVLRSQLGIDLDDATLIAGLNTIFAGLHHEVLTAIATVALEVPVYGFSNTNEVHQRHFESAFAEELAVFEHIFVSNVIGHRKPEAAAFQHVLGVLGRDPGAVLFFDDLAENVAGARAVGMRAVQVTRPHDVVSGLEGAGLLAR